MRQAWHLVLYMHKLFNLLTGHSIERALTAWCLGREGQVCLSRYASGQTQVVTHNLKSRNLSIMGRDTSISRKGPLPDSEGDGQICVVPTTQVQQGAVVPGVLGTWKGIPGSPRPGSGNGEQ